MAGEGISHIHKSNACLFQGRFCGIQIRILIGGRCQGRKLVTEDANCIWCDQSILFQVLMSGCEILHGVYGAVEAFFCGGGKILHQIAAFSKKNTVSFRHSKNSLGGSTKGDPPVAEEKLVIYVGFIVICKFSRGQLGDAKCRAGSQNSVLFLGKTTIRKDEIDHQDHQDKNSEQQSGEMIKIAMSRFLFHRSSKCNVRIAGT